MGRTRKFDYQAAIESQLLSHPEGLTLDQLLERAELKVDRSTLFRHLARLIESGRARRIGNARASRYQLLADSDAEPAPMAPQLPAAQPVSEPARVPAAGPVPEAATGLQGALPQDIPVEAMEHGPVVAKAVRKIVREWKRCSRVNLQIYLSLLVEAELLDEVAAVVEKELAGLHEGNLDRFGLTSAEFSSFVRPTRPEAGAA